MGPPSIKRQISEPLGAATAIAAGLGRALEASQQARQVLYSPYTMHWRRRSRLDRYCTHHTLCTRGVAAG
jgi:hypothetical protein